jgi:hypothetical protein
MAQGHRQRVVGVGALELARELELQAHHARHRVFAVVAAGAHRLLHPRGRVLVHLQPVLRRQKEHHPACLAKDERAAGVLVGEDALHSHRLGLEERDGAAQLDKERVQALAQRCAGIGLHHAVREVGGRAEPLFHEAVAEKPAAWVDSEHSHAWFHP